MTNFTRDEQYTLMTLWSIFKSPLMFEGNLPDNDGFTNSLLTSHGMLEVLNKSINNKPLFNEKEKAAWIADEPGSSAKYLAVFNKADQVLAVEEKAVWKSGLIDRNTPSQSQALDVDISGAKKLFLVVTNGGDNIDWDHEDWINPALYNDQDTQSLTDLKWRKASSGWGSAHINQGVSGSDLMVNKIKYPMGIGVHSNSIIEYDLPQGYTHFKGMAGLDNAAAVQNVGATMQFMVFTEEPSGAVPPQSMTIPINLKDLGFTSSCKITDLWSGRDLGTFSGEFAPEIKRHGAGLYKLVEN